MTDTPPEGQPKLARNRRWREWNVTKNRVIRVPESDWINYAAVCAAENTDRSEDLRAHIDRRIKAWRRKNPGTPLPGDEPAED